MLACCNNKSVAGRARGGEIIMNYLNITRDEKLVCDTLLCHFKDELDKICLGQTTLLSCLIAESFCFAVKQRNLDINNMPLKAMLKAALYYIARDLPADNFSPLIDITICRYRDIARWSLLPKNMH